MNTTIAGFVWRLGIGEARLALICRHGEEVWSLPGGLRAETETWPEAALRIVSADLEQPLEPAGFVDAAHGESAPSRLYFDFFLTTRCPDELETAAGKIRFVLPQEAISVLKDERDCSALRAHTVPAPLKPRVLTAGEWFQLFRRGMNLSYSQLERALALQWAEQRVIEREGLSDASLRARHELRSAEVTALADPERGWSLLKRAKRSQLAAMSEERRAAEWAVISSEARQKLKQWRKEAALQLMEPPATRPAGETEGEAPETTSDRQVPSVEAITKVAELLDGHHDGFFDRARLLQQRIVWSVVILVSFILAFEIFLSASLAEDVSVLHLFGANLIRAAPFLGVVGALCSSLLVSLETNTQRRPQIILDTSLVLAKVALGAGSGVGAVLLFSKVFDTAQLVAASAFAAGFFERLLPAQIERVFGEAEPKKSEPSS